MDAASLFVKLANSERAVCRYKCDQGSAYLINSLDDIRAIMMSAEFGSVPHPFRALRPILSPLGFAWLGIEKRALDFDVMMRRVEGFWGVCPNFSRFGDVNESTLLSSKEFYFDVKAMFFSLSTSLLFDFDLGYEAIDIARASDRIEDARSGRGGQPHCQHSKKPFSGEVEAMAIFHRLANRIQEYRGHNPSVEITHAIIETLLSATIPLAYSFLWTLMLIGRQESSKDTLIRRGVGEIVGDSGFCGRRGRIDYVATIKESLRLYPPVWAIGRVCMETQNLSGTIIRRGESVVISPFALHRAREYWNQASIFLPERFLDDRRQFSAFMPFGMGLRRCPAARWNISFLSSALGWFLSAYSVTVYKLPKHISLVALRPSLGFSISLQARD